MSAYGAPLSLHESSLVDGDLSAQQIPADLISQSVNVFGRDPLIILSDMVLYKVLASQGSFDVIPIGDIPDEYPMPPSGRIRVVYDTRGNIWLYSGWPFVAIYDRSDELVDPTITLTVGLDVIEAQDTTVVNASIAPGQRTYNADVYAVVQTPGGELWSYPWNVEGIHPMAENLHFDPYTFVSDFILFHIEPPIPLAFAQDGEYVVYAALTEPGTLNPIGEIAYVPFELRLSQ